MKSDRSFLELKRLKNYWKSFYTYPNCKIKRAHHRAHHSSTEQQQRAVTNDAHAVPNVSGRRWDATRSNADGDWRASICVGNHRETSSAVLADACVQQDSRQNVHCHARAASDALRTIYTAVLLLVGTE